MRLLSLRRGILGSLFVFFWAALSSPSSAVIYVDKDAVGSNDGSSWVNAFTNLQQALTISTGEFWVADGTYTPGLAATNTFYIGTNLLYGGFIGTETSLNQRDWTNNLTILSGDLGGAVYANNIITKQTNGFAVLDGFTIRDAQGIGTYGAGVSNASGTMAIQNCIFTNLFASQYGGAIYSAGPGLGVTNCTFIQCYTTNGMGGAVYCANAGLKSFNSCLFMSNWAQRPAANSGGGAVVIFGTFNTNEFRNCIFNNNYTTNETLGTANGGAIFVQQASSPTTIEGCSFSDNYTKTFGGACYMPANFVNMTNCTFIGNHTTNSGAGGAIYAANTGLKSFRNCTFLGNYLNNPANNVGGGAVFITSTFDTNEFHNCIFSGNYTTNETMANVSGGAICCDQATSPSIIIDCSFTNNFSKLSGGAIYSMGQYIGITNSTFTGNYSTNAGFGGALDLSGAGLKSISNCVFVSNFVSAPANNWGGGAVTIRTDNDTNVFRNCVFVGNYTTNEGSFMSYGGAVRIEMAYSASLMTDCVFTNNRTKTYGGAVYTPAKATFTGCDFIGNSATNGNGGAVFRANATSNIYANCSFVANSAKVDGGAVSFDNTTAGTDTFINCTFSTNMANTGSGGAIKTVNASTVLNITNCIFWGNWSATSGTNIFNAGIIDMAYSDINTNTISGGTKYYGPGIITINPLFAGGYDVHEQSKYGRWTSAGWTIDGATSPCIDAGNPASAYSSEPLPHGGRINIGRYGNTVEASKSAPVSFSGIISTNITGTSADLVATLSGSNADCVVVYDTNNWGQTLTNWKSTNTLGTLTAGATFTNTLNALMSNTLYYFMFYGTNTSLSEEGYSMACSFMTKGLAYVDNDGGASGITTNSVWLKGTLIAIGMDTGALVRIYWGPSDGGSNELSWANMADFGMNIVTGMFSTNITGLMPSSNYFYRTWASNAIGVSWAPDTTNFMTGGMSPALVANVSLSGLDTNQQKTLINFDIGWSNSWRNATNRDAVWVFAKYRLAGSSTWSHASINYVDGSSVNDGHTAPAGSTIYTPPDGKGAFIYQSTNGQGSVNFPGAQLSWNYGNNGITLTNNADVEINLFAVEMVYVPTGSFYVGSTLGGDTAHCYQYTDGSQSTNPYFISSESSISVGTTNGGLYFSAIGGNYGDGSGPIPTAFPKGYNAFYCMKYEITQGQYAEFLNRLTPLQWTNRFPNQYGLNRHSINGTCTNVTAMAPTRACNFLSWADGAAYADWTGLRPMTELEYEKACRGSAMPVPGEFAWGSTIITQQTGHVGTDGSGIETASPSSANCLYGGGSIQGPVRAGIYAAASSGRINSGASYYGILELSGNLYERIITVGHATARAFQGSHGDGFLAVNGDANASNWPVSNAIGAGFRGGSWLDTPSFARVSDRAYAAYVLSVRNNNFGFRAVRSESLTGGGSMPIIWNGMINPVTSNSALLWFNLASGGTTDVRLCYGTTDGGTTLGNWQTNLFMGGINGPVVASNWANGLLSSQLYYYRTYASNAFGSSWAPMTTNFMTATNISMPTVNISGASGITSNNATLNADLISMGGDTSTWVRIYWGLTNGLANEPNWAYFEDFGQKTSTGPFSTNVGGLIPGTTYYYRAWASNSVGRLWSGGISNFMTAGGFVDSDFDGMEDNWEFSNFGNTTTANAFTDWDGDGLIDAKEYQFVTNPKNPDSDNDNINDYVEILNQTDPNWNGSYPTSPFKQWIRMWGSTNNDITYGMAADTNSEIYAVGWTEGSYDGQTNQGGRDFCLSKFSITGSKMWNRIWGSSANEEAFDVAIDKFNNIYVAGYTEGGFDGQTNQGGRSAFLCKYNVSGTKIWTRIWGSTAFDSPNDIAVDTNGNIYVVGQTSGSFDGQSFGGGTYDGFVTKFAPNGSNLWTRFFGQGGDDVAAAIAIDGSNIYISGETSGSFGSETNYGVIDLIIVKYDENGSNVWNRIFGSDANDAGSDVAVDVQGNIYVAGRSSGIIDGQPNLGVNDFCLSKFDSDGTMLWTRTAGGTGEDIAYSLTVNSFNDIYVLGRTENALDTETNAGLNDVCLMKYDPDGTKFWTRIQGSTSEDYGMAITIDRYDSIYCAGYSFGEFGGQTNNSLGTNDHFITKWRDVPPLTINNLDTIDITETSATLRGDLISTGIFTNSARVWVLWDTNQWSMIFDDWTNKIDMGWRSSGPFQTNITGLSSDTTYYYICYASNLSSSVWASGTTNFMTSLNSPPMSYFVISSLPVYSYTGVYNTVTVQAWQGTNLWTNYLGTVHFTTGTTNSSVPSNYTFTLGDNGVHIFSNAVAFYDWGDQSLNIEDTTNNSMRCGQDIFIFNGYGTTAQRLSIASWQDPVMTGQWSTFSIAVLDDNGGRVTNYTGQVKFSSSDSTASLPFAGSSNYTFTVGDAGWHTFTSDLQFNTIGEHWLKVQDSINSNIYDKIWNMTAKGSGMGTGVTHFVLSDVDHYVWTNEWYDLHIEARDQYENVFENFTGSVLIASSDPSAIYPSNCLFTPGDFGVRHFNNAVQMRTIGTQWIEGRWQANTNIMGGIYGIEVVPEGYAYLEVFHNSAIPGFILSGQWADVTVKAWDAVGNIDSNYVGTVLFSSEDPSVAFALTNYTFTLGDAGIHVFSNLVRYASRGEGVLKVEEAGTPLKWNRSEINVLIGGATNTTSFYVESTPYPFLSNMWHDVYVMAIGDDGRVNTNFSGNVEFVSSDPLVQVTIPVFNSFTNGMAYITNQVSPRTPGDHTFRVQWQADTNICGIGDIMVLGGGTYYYVNGTTGSDINNGLSSGTAWKTIGRAMTNGMAAGDVVIVGPGVYDESVNVGVSGTPNKFFTVYGDEDGRFFSGPTKYDAGINSGNLPAFNVSGQSYVAICNFDIANNSVSSTGIVVQGGNNVRLIGNSIQNRLCAIEINNSPNAVINEIEIGNCSMYGIHVEGASHSLIVQDMYIEEASVGMKIDGGLTNALISHNIFVDNIGGGINISNTTGIIELNDIEGGAYGINVLASSVVEIRNNIIYGAGSDGISFLNAGAGCIVRQNTVAYNGSIALNVNNTPGMDIRNNIFAFNTNSGLYADPASTNGMINSYNCSFGNTINWSGSATAGAGSISVDPMFAANPIQNYVDGHLKSQSGRITAYGWTNDIVTSPCIDAGDPALPWMNELMPNGGRANMGFDGNLKEASRTFFITHSITVLNSDPNGLITPTGTIEVIEGSNFVFTITPSNNYHVGTVNVDAIPIGETNSYTFTNVTSSHSISATFTLNSYDVTASNVVNGSIMPTGTMMVTHGSMQPYTITADPNYHVVDVWIDGTNNIGPTNDFTFMNVTNGGHTIYATFAIDTYTLNVTSPFGMPDPAGLTTNNWNASINAYLAGSPTNFGSTQYVCTGWSGTGSVGSGPGTNTSFNITMNSTLNWMWSSNYWLATTSAPNGYVDVSSMWVQASSNVMIQAYPSNGYHFLNWTGDITTNMNPLNIFMSQPYSVQANFELNSYDIMASPPVNGSVSPSGTVWVGHGSNMTFTITPNTNYHVLNVTIDGTNSIGATNSYTFMNVTNGGHSVNVTFAIDEFSLSVTSDHGAPTPSGLTSNVWNFFISPSVSTPVPDGAYTQYVCKGWVGSGSVPATGNTNSFGFNLTSNSTLTWLWETDYYFNANAGANGGVDVMSDWKLAGSNFNITATPSNGYHFVNWTGDISSTNNPLSITMTQGYLITANFAINTYDVTASNVVNGSIMPTGTMMVTHGSSQPYTITPSSNYHVVNVWIDGTNNIGPTNNFTFMNVTNGGHTIYATFALDTCTLSVTTPFGVPTPSGMTTNNYNDFINASLAGSPTNFGSTQYVAIGWTGTGSVTPGSGTNTSFNITFNSTLDWQWSSNYWLATTSGPNGYVDVSSMWIGSGSNILVTAYPSNGYQFSGWTGSIVTNINPLNVMMTAPQNIQANFIITSNDIMVSAGPDGNITPSGTQWVPYNGSANFAITPNPNYHVLDVLVDGSSVGAVTNYNFTNVTNARTISASFAIDTYTLNVSSLYDSPTPSGLTTNNWNTPINAFVASSVMNGAVTQFVCTGWSGSGSTPASGTSNAVSFNLTSNSTLTWNWKTQYYFNAMAVGMGSVITTNGWCDRGSIISATAVPTNGYTFNGWTGDIVTNMPTVTPIMNQSFDLTANFTIIQYNITASAGAGGMISPAGTNLVNYGNNLGFTVMPNANYHIVSVTIDGTNNIGATNSYTFINVTNNHTISATFAIDTYGLAVTSPYGTPTPGLGTNTFNYGATTTCSVAGSPVIAGTTQYVATGWTGTGNITAGSGTSSGPIIITQNSSINWTWNTLYFLTCSAGSTNGSVDVTNSWYSSGNMAVITATPNGGFVFGGWTGNVPVSNAMANPLNLTMDQARSVTATFVPPMGNVQVNLSPVAAITNGAQWRLISGPDTNWHASGFIVTNVPVGGSPYTLTFKPITGFTKPLDKTDVMVTDGATTVRAGNYMVGSMVLIPAGSFNMGGAGGPVINISSFYLDTREVTVGEYQWFCASAPSTMPPAPPWGWGNTNLPMCNLTWNEAAGYAAWAGKRLPTEAEFEYAMRGGAPNNLYPWGNTITPSDANYGNTNGPVAGMGYSGNGYGLYDVAGNVWEWCNDWYGGFISAPATDPQGAGSGTYKMIRGGSYVNSTIALQCASRYFTTPTVRHLDTGFRCASTMGLIGGGATPDDANNNGIPEWWEQYYFGLSISGGTPFDPTADLDGDGLNNAQEYAAGTDPTSASSVLALTTPTNSAPYGFVVSWNSVAGKYYIIERCVKLTDGFSSIATNIPATYPMNTYTDTVSGADCYYYKVKVQP